MALAKSTALELVVLAGHLLLYPSGISQERREPPPHADPPPDTPAAAALADVALTDVALTDVTLADPAVTGTAVTEPATPSAPALDPAPAPTPSAEVPPVPARDRRRTRPVVLLHGFIDNRSVFVLLRRSLAQHDRYRVHSLNHSPLTHDIRAAAGLLGQHIDELCRGTDEPEVDIVGHSLGGLIARYYVQRLGGDVRVRTLVTLGTPHSGTLAAPLMNAHPIVRQMRPGSELMAELRAPAPHCVTRFFAFWSELDQVMVPRETACLTHPDLHSQNVRVTGIGHLALPVHPAVAAAVCQALEAGATTGRTAGGFGVPGNATVA
ncbi:lipase family alpha/beta hydrolase [Streptomyces tsukubensis]|uniref:lipase family alpha/beta hydrolase n=1 Tax=Streptomyces tsukubensis TaxID=83656 RepID=UPI001D03BD64|nr:alpha/beta fold hydrolase [Streptomyces tsukubensis]